MTTDQLIDALARFGGVLCHGQHTADSKACLLEFDHAVRGDAWTDAPGRLPDLRPLNDGPWSSDAARTEALLPLQAAYYAWATWPHARQLAVITRVVIATVRELIADLPRLPASVSASCRAVTTLAEAAAGWAAEDAAAADQILHRACTLWVRAVTEA